jgi:hypothetical protein
MMIDIKELKNLVNEIRIKLNIVMAGDYGWDEEDVKIANQINEMVMKGEETTMIPSSRDDLSTEELERVTKLLLEDFSYIRDKTN